MVPKDVVIEIRSDGGLEFNNATVREYCNKNNIIHHILPKAHPWLNAFIERAIETLQYEFINLQYHATFNDFQNFLVITKNGYNLREHSSFNYRSPVEIWNSSGVSLSVCDKKSCPRLWINPPPFRLGCSYCDMRSW